VIEIKWDCVSTYRPLAIFQIEYQTSYTHLSIYLFHNFVVEEIAMMSEQNTRLRCRMSWLALLTIMALCLQSSYVDARLRSGNNNQSSKEQLADGPEIERQLRKKEKKVMPMSQAAITIREDANELTPFPEGKVPRNGVEIEIDLENLNTIEDDNKNDNKKRREV